MSEDEIAELRQVLIREGVGLLVVLAVVWYMGQGRILIGGIRRRAELYREGSRSAVDIEVADFAGKVNRWDHEQAAQAHRRPAKDGGCGCG